MSVVVQAATLISPRVCVDAGYPGGARAYLAAMISPAYGASWACADDHLVAACFMDHTLDPALKRLSDFDFDRDWEGYTQGWVIVDEITGPRPDVPWIAWERTEDRTEAWLATQDRGTLVVPDGWKPGPSVRFDLRDAPHMVKVGEEDGLGIWLNTLTSELRPLLLDPEDAQPGPIMRVMRLAVEERCSGCTVRSPRFVTASFLAGFMLHELSVRVDEDAGFIVCEAVMPFVAPKPERARASKFALAIADLNVFHKAELCRLDRATGRISAQFAMHVKGKMSNAKAEETLRSIGALCQDVHAALLPLLGPYAEFGAGV